MKKLTIEAIGKVKVNPVFKGLPDTLKDTKNFKGIEKKLSAVMFSDHKHRLIKSFTKCKRCNAKFEEKRRMVRELDFSSMNQYQNWKKIMQIIINKKELVLYEK